VKTLHKVGSSLFEAVYNRLNQNRFRTEFHYELGGDFNPMYSSNYIGSYLGIIDFCDHIFHSTIPNRESDYLRIWKDREKHSIVMHDKYNFLEKNLHKEICELVIKKSCVTLFRRNSYDMSKAQFTDDCFKQSVVVCSNTVDT
jgi:hypothetical protein